MESVNVDIINNFAKIFYICFLSFFIYVRVIKIRTLSINNTIIVFLESICIAFIYIVLDQFITSIGAVAISFLLYGLAIRYTISSKIKYFVVIYSMAILITYIIYFISIMIVGMIVTAFNINYKNHIILAFILAIMSLIIFSLSKIRRFKSGFNFLKSSKISINIISFIILFSSIIITTFILFQKRNNKLLNEILLFINIFCIIILIIWIKTQITKTYKNRMRDRTIEIQKAEIDEQTRIIEEIKAENIKLGTAIHKYNHKFSSLEHAMKSALNLDSKTEFANELSVILKETEETSKNFANETGVTINKLPLTNIVGIDNMFKYMQEEARKNNINFDLKINENINSLIGNIIPKEKFEILIGDHIKDAIIAINASKTSYKSILVTIGLVQGTYEFSIYDTGIEFEIDTLLKLGEEQITTHKDEGGSGIGFMTTFKTLKECMASLVIEEYNPETTNYTKSVTIRFDGRNEYKICSYRAEKIKEQKHKRRIVINKIQ